jgi:hypothetical protein
MKNILQTLYLVPRKKSSTLTDNGKVVIRTLENWAVRKRVGSDSVVYSSSGLTL